MIGQSAVWIGVLLSFCQDNSAEDVARLAMAIESGQELVPAIVAVRNVVEDGQVPEGSVALLVQLLHAKSPRVRLEAAEAIALIAANEPDMVADYVPSVADALKSATTSTRERCELLAAIASLHDRAADSRQVLRQIVMGGNDFERVRAAVALSQTDPSDMEGINRLIEWLTSSRSQLRWTAAYGLSLLGERAQEAAPALRLAIRDPHPSVRAYACRALWRINQDSAAVLSTLEEDLEIEPESAIIAPTSASAYHVDHVVIVIGTLGEIGPHAQPAQERLLRVLQSDDVAKQQVAIRALAQIVDNPKEFLRACANDPREQLRRFAAQELQQLQSTSDER